ncbi:MAG: hypothetical protein K0S47_3831 [Herbinix sp.]|jgi:hypothetical protein|nr:hypothetical protein [Herbinix sp.]
MLQVVREQDLDYDSFIQEVLLRMREVMGEDYEIQTVKVMKNNALEFKSLVILKEGKNIAPNIYLDSYYNSYQQGTALEEIIDRIYLVYHNCSDTVVKDSFSYSLQEMKTCIIYRLVNYDKNKSMLSQIPHIKFLDLAITFHCLVRNDEDGIGTIRITNEHLQLWNTDINEISSLAGENTRKLFPVSIRSMDEVIKGMLYDEYINGEEDLPEDWIDRLFEKRDKDKPSQNMFILSNQQGINGATCILYPNIIHAFADRMKSDIYILPSSIHEIILVPYTKNIKKESLTEMVKEINRTQVAPEEVLSDQVYFYSRSNKSFHI